MRGRTIAFVLAALTSVAWATGCGASQARPATPGAAASDTSIARTEPVSWRCIHKVKIVGASFASGNDRAARKAHDWSRTISCPRGGSPIGPW